MCHVIPVKKKKENDFSMEFSLRSLSREIDSLEGFQRIMSISGAAFDATLPPFLSALVLLLFEKYCLIVLYKCNDFLNASLDFNSLKSFGKLFLFISPLY